MNSGWSEEAFEEEYEARKQAETTSLKKRRQELTRHRNLIAKCNILLVCEGVTLIVLIIALILNW